MPTDIGMPAHFSYSSLSSWITCGKSWELSRIAKVPEIPSYWFCGGRAVHAVTEAYDNAPDQDWSEETLKTVWGEIFGTEVENQRARFPNMTKWRTAGRKSKANPDGEDYLRWMDLGPQFVQNYINWRQESNWAIWYTGTDGVWPPDGQDAIELELDLPVGNWRMKGAIDRVFWHPNGRDLVVCDIKTGSRQPDSDLQLGLYAAGMEAQYGVRPRFGMYYMARLDKPSQLFELDTYSGSYVEAMGGQLRRAVKEQIFVPHKTVLCGYCAVSHGCATVGGKDAHLYDPLSPNYQGVTNG